MSASIEKRRRQAEWEARPEVQAARAAELCGARAKSTGKPCRSRGVGAGGRCVKHGGASTGKKVWSSGGRYSKQLKGVLSGLFEAVESRSRSETLLDLEQTIAFFDEVRDRLLVRADAEGDTPGFRRRMHEIAKQIKTKVAAQDPSFVSDLEDLVEGLRRGVGADQALLEALAVAERRAKRAEAARTVAAREAATVPAAAYEAYTETVARIVAQHIGIERASAVLRAVLKAYSIKGPVGARPLRLVEGGAA